MNTEPAPRRAVIFIDGQNLFRSAKDAFGHNYPNYDPIALARAICLREGWELCQVRFYTGYPDPADNPFWNHFWTSKFAQMGRQGIHVFSRTLRYRNETIIQPDGRESTVMVGREKGIDVRLALDILLLGFRREYDVAVVFSQDQDLSEVADEIRILAKSQGRWIKIVSAFPMSPTSKNRRGINGTDWLKVDRETYTSCIDPRDYRPKKPPISTSEN
ncbi:MAG: NYN domain-containing protein [Verrucomicrobia bacterium]|nr:NYN domain-containing protein [Verrucomicrobiota bacterium]